MLVFPNVKVSQISLLPTLMDDSDDFGKSYETQLIENFVKRLFDAFVQTPVELDIAYRSHYILWSMLSTRVPYLFVRTLDTRVFANVSTSSPELFQVTEKVFFRGLVLLEDARTVNDAQPKVHLVCFAKPFNRARRRTRYNDSNDSPRSPLRALAVRS